MKLPYGATLLTLALLAATQLSPSLVTAGPATQGPPEKPISVFLVRHAETTASTREVEDPPLSEDGQARATALARLVSGAGVTHLFASEYARTQATLAPLAEGLSLEVEVIPARSTDQQLAALRALPPGSVAVVAGHSNTVPDLVSALGGVAGEPIDHEEYDRVFLVVLPALAEDFVPSYELHYGP